MERIEDDATAPDENERDSEKTPCWMLCESMLAWLGNCSGILLEAIEAYIRATTSCACSSQ